MLLQTRLYSDKLIWKGPGLVNQLSVLPVTTGSIVQVQCTRYLYDIAPLPGTTGTTGMSDIVAIPGTWYWSTCTVILSIKCCETGAYDIGRMVIASCRHLNLRRHDPNPYPNSEDQFRTDIVDAVYAWFYDIFEIYASGGVYTRKF